MDQDEKRNQPPDKELLHKRLQDVLAHDELMARCVLEHDQKVLNNYKKFDDKRAKTLPLIKWMGNLITLAGTFLYAKFNQWRVGTGANPENKEWPNALYLERLLSGVQGTKACFEQASSGLRVLRVLDGLYDSFDMNFHVIKYLIINSQIEVGYNYKNGKGLSKLMGFPHDEYFRIVCDPDDDDSEGRFGKEGQNLAAAFNFISRYRSDPNIIVGSTKDYPPCDIEWVFNDVFKTMKFMQHVKLDIGSEGNVNFKETVGGELRDIPSHGVVRVLKKDENRTCVGVCNSGEELLKDFTTSFYFLEKMEYISKSDTLNAAVSFLYQSFDERDTGIAYFSEKDGLALEDFDLVLDREESAAECFKRVSGYLPGIRSVSPFFRGMVTAHYRYHNILAASIVDAIDKDHDDAKNRILQKFVKKDKFSFEETLRQAFKTLESAFGEKFENDKKEESDEWEYNIDKLCDYISKEKYKFRTIIDWDTLMARILIYDGPSEILKAVLLSDKDKYEIRDKGDIENTCRLIIAGLEMRYIDKIFEASEVAENQGKSYEHIKGKLAGLRNFYPDDITFIKVECKALAQSYIDAVINELTRIKQNDTERIKNKFAENSIQDTLEVLKMYKGTRNTKAYKAFIEIVKVFLSFYAGIRESCRSRMSYEFEKSMSILLPGEIEKRQSDISKEFSDGVKKKAAELSKLFKDVLKETDAVKLALNKLWEFAEMPSDEVRYYNAVLARAPINKKKLAYVFHVDDEKIMLRCDGGEIDFEKANANCRIIECLENIVRFLAGEDISEINKNYDKNNYTVYKEYARKVVYPQIVTFVKPREVIMDHNGAFAVWRNGEVQILTEFKYDIDQSYYALPNMNRIEADWWVDPILVLCSDFDEKIRNASTKVEKESAK